MGAVIPAVVAKVFRTTAPSWPGRHDVVVITINYRLGPLGWFRHPAPQHRFLLRTIPATTARWISSQALKWVQTNIASFGGDPDKVTIFW